jgi:hypothetical protein
LLEPSAVSFNLGQQNKMALNETNEELLMIEKTVDVHGDVEHFENEAEKFVTDIFNQTEIVSDDDEKSNQDDSAISSDNGARAVDVQTPQTPAAQETVEIRAGSSNSLTCDENADHEEHQDEHEEHEEHSERWVENISEDTLEERLTTMNQQSKSPADVSVHSVDSVTQVVDSEPTVEIVPRNKTIFENRPPSELVSYTYP